jgi:hypothetical protein
MKICNSLFIQANNIDIVCKVNLLGANHSKIKLQVPVSMMYESSDCLPEVFLQELTPTFLALSGMKSLGRCVCGTTQCPKHKHHSIKVVQCAVASAALCEFDVPNINITAFFTNFRNNLL